MKNFLIPALFFLCLELNAQNSYIYEFKNNLNETSGKGPILTTLGQKGSYVEESLPELGGARRTVYKFDKNCGLNYNMNTSGLNLKGSYTIEIYFKFDALESWKRVIDFKNRTTDNGAYIFNGKLNFYNIVTSEISPVAAGEYTHYTFTYDASSNTVKIYADGIGKISFKDIQRDAQIDPNELHFFYDDLKVNNEASSGTVAYIKLFDYAVTPEEAKKNFEDLKKTVIKEETIPVVEIKKPKLILTLIDASTLVPLAGNFTIINKETGKTFTLYTVGKSEIELTKGTYEISAKSKLFAKNVEVIDFNINEGTLSKEIRLTQVKIGENVKLDNVHFKQGKAELLPESFPVLDKLVKMLNDNNSMEIELSGHTDNVGVPALNLKLSEDRVDVIKNYLISKGINGNRVKGKGYGGSMPIASNAKEETRKLNRRVDFKITKF
jgi:OOP family OmpA-OmpF porin